MGLNPDEEMKMTYTSVLEKDGKPLVSLRFDRGKDYCEANMPDCQVVKNCGFTDDEIEALEQYLSMNRKQIIDNSKGISGFTKIFS